jgi:hypothetical protein
MKKSFILYVDTLGILNELTDEQAGQLFRKIYEYHIKEKPKETEKTQSVNSVIELIFFPFKAQFDRDLQTYMSVCDRNRNNGLKGGRPKIKTQNNPKNLDSDSDSDNDTDNDNEKDKKFNFKKALLNFGFNKELIEDWLVVRKKKKAANTKTAFNGFVSEIEKGMLDKNDVLRLCVEKNWIGFKVNWEHGLKQKQDLKPKKIRQQDYYSYEEYLYDCKKFNVTPEPQL